MTDISENWLINNSKLKIEFLLLVQLYILDHKGNSLELNTYKLCRR